MHYEINNGGESLQATLSEKITFSDHDIFREMISTMLNDQTAQQVIDLSAVDFIDSAGLGMLLLARDEISKTNKTLVLKAPQGQVKRMFDVARFDTMFTIEH
ncbi:MAG: anti-anti-sigma factor [Kordiimonas sp.]|nr:anti-anti-sigma factor [Kordiimonas sp.]|tara:strand:+ start:635 stop:940 length:306 start_codon:yes stop_codon:yes gene_type:complete